MEDLKALTECAECTWDYIDRLRMAIAAACKERDEVRKELHEDKSELLKYREAEQDGRLVVLPCKVADRVFHVRRVTQAEAKRMGAPVRHRGIVYYEDRPFAIKEKLCTKSDYAQIGKTVFLTREEAEAALALKGGEG